MKMHLKMSSAQWQPFYRGGGGVGVGGGGGVGCGGEILIFHEKEFQLFVPSLCQEMMKMQIYVFPQTI